MKPEAGKRYIRRDGSVSPALIPDTWGWGNHVQDPETEMVFVENGQVFTYQNDGYDLVEEYSPTKIEVGKKYVLVKPHEDYITPKKGDVVIVTSLTTENSGMVKHGNVNQEHCSLEDDSWWLYMRDLDQRLLLLNE